MIHHQSARQVIDEHPYYDNPRPEVITHFPDKTKRVLEIGCGTGATLQAIREKLDLEWIGGVELNKEAAERARPVCDKVWNVDVEAYELGEVIEAGTLDVILCLDVLEHLVDPWEQIWRFSKLLRPGGVLIASIPNIRYYKVGFNLYFKGDFRYCDSGILDRTHLRFFVKETIEELVTCSGLELLECQPVKPPKPFRANWILGRLTFGWFDKLSAKQYIAVARASDTSSP